MLLTDMADDVRMAHRNAIELAGGMVDGYDGEWFRVSIPNPSGPFYDRMADAGFIGCDKSLHFFPLGSDKPPVEYRHDGRYKGSKGFWLYGRFKPRSEHTCAGFDDATCVACNE